MRVLCLHPAASSALQFSRELHKLEERLWEKHGIELVFVDGPLLDVQIGESVGQENGGINAIEPSSGIGGGEERVSRRWYVKESARGALPSTDSAEQPSQSATQYSGLDASLLHLSQIWSRGGANISNNLGECLPFQGVLGVGQGADVAGLLPLLNYQTVVDDGSDDEKENDDTNDKLDRPTIFQGLQFVILIDGKDILCRRNEDSGEEEVESDVYVGPDGVQSLHIIMEKNENYQEDQSSSGERLAKQYGPNATIHKTKQCKEVCTPALSNTIGKFLVSQKNKLHSNSKSRELMSLQNQLANVEQLATLAISQEIQRNPPKALMAVIGPTAMVMPDDNESVIDNNDQEEGKKNNYNTQQHGGKENMKVVDKAVGAWHGARRRAFGEEGGGAPCPEEFLLREEER